MEKQDRLSDAQRDYVDTVRGGVAGSLTSKEFAYALDSYLNSTPIETVVERILSDRQSESGGKTRGDDSTLH